MKKFIYIVSIGIIMFYYFNPILENKNLVLSKTLSIEKEPKNYYHILDKQARNKKDSELKEYMYLYYLQFVYVDSLLKYKNMWIGYIGSGECTGEGQLFSGHYIRGIEKGEYPSLYGEMEKDICVWLEKNRNGYFYVLNDGSVKYNLTQKEVEEELNIKFENVKFKNPNYYIQKYGKNKDTNEFYFSGDSTESMFQKTKEVKKNAYLTKNILYLIFVFPAIIFIVMDLKIMKKNKKENQNQNNNNNNNNRKKMRIYFDNVDLYRKKNKNIRDILKLSNKIKILKVLNIILFIFVAIFYMLNPIYENKELILNKNFIIKKEPFSKTYRIINEINRNDPNKIMFLKGLKKNKNNWVGEIYTCYESFIHADYSDLNVYDSSLFPEKEELDCEIINSYSGYFLISGDEIKYNIETEEKLKNPNYYIQKNGENKGTNEFYFSGDAQHRAEQIDEEVKEKIILTRKKIFSVLIISLILLHLLEKILKKYKF